MDVAVDTQLTDLTCSTCGGHFSLVDQSKATRMAPSLTKLGRFELIERLGVGGYGSVWKARDKELDRTVAIKIPRQGGMAAEEQEKFFREARAAAQLRHPNIVSVHEVGRDGDSVYIVSDFVRGVTLGDWLTGQRLTNREAAELCARIAEALHHAHEQGIIHRDLKPANIIIDGDGQPHLMDFGLARREVGEVTVTMDGQVLGTPAYMSPEQAQGEAHTADRRSDVYSLGVILFQLVTGELPFRGNARMLMHQVIHDEPPSPRKLNSNVAKDLETITLKCLEKDPVRRYATAAELAKELERYLSGEPIQARPIGGVERSWRWVKRNPRVAILTASVIVLLVVVASLSSIGYAIAKRQQLAAQEAAEREASLRTQSEQNLKLAQEAVDGYLTRVAEDERLKQDDFLKLRAELLKTAIPFYERFAQQRPGDAESAINQANAYSRLASIFGEVGQEKRAAAEYRKAIDIQTGLMSKTPSPEWREVAKNQTELAWNLQLSGDTTTAKAIYNSTVWLLDELLKKYPDDRRSQEILVRAHQRYGILLRDKRDATAKDNFEEAVKIATALAEANPQSTEDRNLLAISLFYLGHHYIRSKEPATAKAHLLRAIEIQRKIVDEYPKVTEYRACLAETVSALGDALEDLSDINGKRKAYDEAVALDQQVLREMPSVVKYRKHIARTLHSYSSFLEKQVADLRGALEKNNERLPFIEQTAAEFPDDPKYARSASEIHLRSAQLLKKMADRAGAKAQLQRAIEIYEKPIARVSEMPDDRFIASQSYAEFALLETQLGELAAARKHYEQVVQIRERLVTDFPNDAKYRIALADSLVWLSRSLATSLDKENRDSSRAVELAERACELSDYDLPQLDALVAAYYRTGQTRAQGAVLDQALSKALKKLGERPENNESLERAVSLHARIATWLERNGEVKSAIQHRNDALQCTDKLVRANPPAYEYRYDAAYQHEQLARLLEGTDPASARNHAKQRLEILHKLVTEFPKKEEPMAGAIDAHWWYIDRAQRSGDKEELQKHYRAMLAIWDRRITAFPSNANAFRDFAWALVNAPGPSLRDYSKAISLSKKACELNKYQNPSYVQSLAYAARLARDFDTSKTNYQRAIGMYEKSLAASPKDRQKRESLAYAHSGFAGGLAENREIAASGRQHELALTIWEQLATDYPSERRYADLVVQTHQWLGEIFEQLNDKESAKVHYREALNAYDRRLNPRNQSIAGWIQGAFSSDPRREELVRALDKYKPAPTAEDSAANSEQKPTK
jgi:tetratricopeptide (TPR) repeat protein